MFVAETADTLVPSACLPACLAVPDVAVGAGGLGDESCAADQSALRNIKRAPTMPYSKSGPALSHTLQIKHGGGGGEACEKKKKRDT